MDGGVEREKRERGGGKERGFNVEKLVIKEVPTSRRGGASPKLLFLLLPAPRSHRRPSPSPAAAPSFDHEPASVDLPPHTPLSIYAQV